jgi:hypothetical protein
MMGRELSGLSYPQIGISDGHHPISHNNYGHQVRWARRRRRTRYHLKHKLAGFLERL